MQAALIACGERNAIRPNATMSPLSWHSQMVCHLLSIFGAVVGVDHAITFPVRSLPVADAFRHIQYVFANGSATGWWFADFSKPPEKPDLSVTDKMVKGAAYSRSSLPLSSLARKKACSHHISSVTLQRFMPLLHTWPSLRPQTRRSS